MKPIDINILKLKKMFSICTLVTNMNEYQEMIDSFVASGFNEMNSEFLFINNSQKNTLDAYEGIRHFLLSSQGCYIIICHQDILLRYDNIEILLQRLKELEEIDPDWAVAGNAGGIGIGQLALKISDFQCYKSAYWGTPYKS
jgi:hypothetical protein